MWYDLENNKIIHYHHEARLLRPNTSFPSVITEDMLNAHNFASVTIDQTPIYDESTHTCNLKTVPEFINDKWILKWEEPVIK